MSELRRRFTPLTMLLLSINGMIGSAWLFVPLYAAKIAGPFVLIAWLLGGAATILIALSFAELSTLLPIPGGTSHFPRFSHGSVASFIISWVAWLSCVTMPPIEVQAVLQYASTYFTELTYIHDGTATLTHLGMLWAAIIMFGLCAFNVVSYKGLVRVNFFLFTFKILVIGLIIFMLLKTNFHEGNFAGFSTGIHLTDWHNILAAVAGGGIAFSLTGFKHGTELAGECRNPQRAVPLAIIGSVTFCLFCYLGLQVAFIGALNPHSLLTGWQHLSFSGDIGPFVGIASLLGLTWLVKILYVDAVVSPLGAGLIYVTSTARIVYAMSQRGFLSPIFTRLNKENFPIWAIVLNGMVGMLLFLPLPGWQAMVNFLVSAVVISYAIGPIGLLCMRLQLPHEIRSFRLPAAKSICIIAFYCCNLISYWTGWETISKLAIAILMGIGLFIVACWRGRIAKTQLHLQSLWWLVPYLAGLLIISYLGSFGGKQIIPFGWDFLVIGLFSLVILWLSVISRLKVVHEDFYLYKNAMLTLG